MKILLVNPPNSGRSIPEEKFGIESIKQILRGEPMALEALAGNLVDEHDVRIVDLKADPGGLDKALSSFSPDIVGFTAVTCEANTVLKLVAEIRENLEVKIIVGGIHASSDPEFFNTSEIDYIVIGLGKASFRELVTVLAQGTDASMVPGVAVTRPGSILKYHQRKYSSVDLVDAKPPAYDLVSEYRKTYKVEALNIDMGFVATAFGCPFSCSFCCIKALTGGRYLHHEIDSILRDIKLLREVPVIRLLDANTFGNPEQSDLLCKTLKRAGIKKQYVADVRSDTVVKHPELMRQWKGIGLRAVIIGFEEISNAGLTRMNKVNTVAVNTEAIEILHDIGITIIGDFIVSPQYDEHDFSRLQNYITTHKVDLPMITVMTPLPGTRQYDKMKNEIIIDDLDYYTLTNAVVPTKMDQRDFYQQYAEILRQGHAQAKI